MTRQMKWGAGAAALVLGVWLILTPQTSSADDEVPKDVKDAILKVADLLGADKKDDAKKEVDALVMKKMYDGSKVGSLKDPMHALSLKSKGGIGISDKIKPDGIEAKIIDLGKKALGAAALKDQGADLKKAAYVALAVADITAASAPKKDDPKKKIKDWDKWAKEMQGAAKDLAAAIDKGDTKAIMNSAKNLDGTCSSCHEVFRPK